MSVYELIDRVDDLTPGELMPLLDAVLERYRELFPECFVFKGPLR